jgi:hypothetical protein
MNDIQAPAPVDVVGRIISFRPTPSSDILIGEVIKVWYDIVPHPTQYRKLNTMIRVELPDGRQLNMKAEPEDVKRYRMVAENLNDNNW